jgi:hypothetical protein
MSSKLDIIDQCPPLSGTGQLSGTRKNRVNRRLGSEGCRSRSVTLGSPQHHEGIGHLADPHGSDCRLLIVGVIDAVRGSSSNSQAAPAGGTVSEPLTTTTLPVQTDTDSSVTTEPVSVTEPPDATVTATESVVPEHCLRVRPINSGSPPRSGMAWRQSYFFA